jgi:hypothetical protein
MHFRKILQSIKKQKLFKVLELNLICLFYLFSVNLFAATYIQFLFIYFILANNYC